MPCTRGARNIRCAPARSDRPDRMRSVAMPAIDSLTRRQLLRRFAAVAALVPCGALLGRSARAAAAPLLAPVAPEAKAVQYTESAASAKAAGAGASCASCALYQGAAGSAQGPCQLFPGKDVKAAGWCTAWAPQM